MHDQLTAPLSPAQQLLCWVDDVAPGVVFGPRFVAVGGYRIGGPLDLSVLQVALDSLVVRHEALRTVIVRDARAPYRRILPPAPVRLVEVAPDRLIETVATGDYPCATAPLLWAFLARHGAADASLVLVAHHTVADPWSMRILIEDLTRGYAGELTGELPPSPWDSVPAAPRRNDEERGERLAGYWRQVLADTSGLPLPAPPPGGTAGTSELRFPVTATEARVKAAARALRTTPFVLLFTGFMGALGEISGTGDITVPVLTYGRDRSDWRTAGFFMNALPVRADLTGDPTPAETFARVHAAFVAAHTRELPLVELLSRIPQAVRFFAPDGPVSAQFEIIQLPPAEQSGPLSYRPLRLPPRLPLGGPVLPVNGLAVWLEQDADGGYTGTIRYRSDLYGAGTVEKLVERYAELLDHLVPS